MEAAAVAGTDPRQLTFEVGGRTPTGSRITLVGGGVEIPGEYEKGQIVELRVVAEIGEVAFADKRDSKTGMVIDCTRVHKARVSSLRVERAIGEVEQSGE